MPNRTRSISSRDESKPIAERVLEQVDVMLGYWDRDQRCRYANVAYQRWLGKSSRELIGMLKYSLIGSLYEVNEPYILGALRGHPQTFERSVELPDGHRRHYVVSYYPDISKGRVEGFSVHGIDVTPMKHIELELQSARMAAEHRATHDFLTGLPNRVHLHERIDTAIRHARSMHGLAGVVAIDFDNFKMINDRYGHDMGDRFLQEIARRMRLAIRDTDSVTRLGGDEFIYLATSISACTNLHAAINRLRLTVSQPFQHMSAVIMPSFSCGVSVFPWHGHSAADMLERADRALYQAKGQGPGSIAFALPG